jgi:hypothetical protein
MASSEERIKVLKMVADGKITPEVASELLKALDAADKPRVSSSTAVDSGKGGRYFRVTVTDTTTGRTRVNVRMPLGMVNAGMRMGMRLAPELEGLDSEQLAEALTSGQTGQIVDVFDDEDGEHVEVFIE